MTKFMDKLSITSVNQKLIGGGLNLSRLIKNNYKNKDYEVTSRNTRVFS